MMPLHASSLTACTFHFFYNAPSLAVRTRPCRRRPLMPPPSLSTGSLLSVQRRSRSRRSSLYFYPSLQGLVTLQAGLTALGNCTLALGAMQVAKTYEVRWPGAPQRDLRPRARGFSARRNVT